MGNYIEEGVLLCVLLVLEYLVFFLLSWCQNIWNSHPVLVSLNIEGFSCQGKFICFYDGFVVHVFLKMSLLLKVLQILPFPPLNSPPSTHPSRPSHSSVHGLCICARWFYFQCVPSHPDPLFPVNTGPALPRGGRELLVFLCLCRSFPLLRCHALPVWSAPFPPRWSAPAVQTIPGNGWLSGGPPGGSNQSLARLDSSVALGSCRLNH